MMALYWYNIVFQMSLFYFAEIKRNKYMKKYENNCEML